MSQFSLIRIRYNNHLMQYFCQFRDYDDVLLDRTTLEIPDIKQMNANLRILISQIQRKS